MELKHFDLEAAKRGEPIEMVYTPGEWINVHFVGMSVEGYLVVQYRLDDGTEQMTVCNPIDLRMAPKKKVWYCRHWLEAGGMPRLHASRTPMDGDANANWYGPEFTIEVEE